MRGTHIYSSDQLHKLTEVHRTLCDHRGIDPVSEDGRDLAVRLLNRYRGDEAKEEMLRCFAH